MISAIGRVKILHYRVVSYLIMRGLGDDEKRAQNIGTKSDVNV